MVRMMVRFVIAFLLAGFSTSAGANDPLAKHQLWLVSTRFASSCDPSEAETAKLKFWRCDADRRWRASRLGEMLQADEAPANTLVYIPENRVGRDESFRRAWHIFASVSRAVPPDQRVRLIVISWPSDRIGRRQRPDAQIKAQRSEVHAFYLAWLLDKMNPDAPVGLFGHSYGPRMITAALHYLGGGSIDGVRLAKRAHASRRPVRAALLAAAIDAHGLSRHAEYGKALSQVEHMLIVVTGCDTALRWYPWLWGRGGPQALGYFGLSCDECLGADRAKIVVHDATADVGRSHSWTDYEGSPTMMTRIVENLIPGARSAGGPASEAKR
jgi:hypothetical protein